MLVAIGPGFRDGDLLFLYLGFVFKADDLTDLSFTNGSWFGLLCWVLSGLLSTISEEVTNYNLGSEELNSTYLEP